MTSVTLTVLLGVIAACNLGSLAQDTSHNVLYLPIGSCEVNQVCMYKYTSEQQQFGTKQEQSISVGATVETLCNSVGIYNGTKATEYCMEIRQFSIAGPMFSDSQQKRALENYAKKNLAGWFCFVQTAEGKVSSVFHESTENSEAVNMKKSIVAAFQANFKGTEEEEELDPQSKHVSHYSYASTEEGVQKMHRSISSKDVEEYSSEAKPRDVKLSKEEDVEYRSGSLYSSSGASSVEILSKRHQDIVDEEDQPDNLFKSDTLTVSGSYRLDRMRCYTLSNNELPQRKRRSADTTNVVETTLSATIDKRSTAKEHLEILRKQLPSPLHALKKLHREPEKIHLASKLQQILILEAEHGPLPGTSPALTDVLNYLKKLNQDASSDGEIRQTVHSLLAHEGSKESQMVLLKAVLYGSDEEQDSAIIHIAFIDNAHIDFVKVIEELMKKDTEKTDALVLAYGALAATASSSVQHRIVSFIKQRLMQQMALNDTSNTVHLLHALGNTGSKNITNLLFDYFSHSGSVEVKLAALGATRKLTAHKPVHDAFIVVLESNPDECIVEEIAKTLLIGEEHSQNFGEHVEENNELLKSLGASSMRFKNNTDLHLLIQQYLEMVDTAESHRLVEFLEKQTGSKRVRRQGTSDWDASNSLYDHIASRSARRNDVSTYPTHKAYIWGKKLGHSKVNVQLAAGVFAGGSSTGAKLFGKAIAKGYLFGRSKTVAEAVAEARSDGNRVHLKLYAKIGSNILVDHSQTRSLCLTKRRKLLSTRFMVVRIQLSVHVYVTTISLFAELNAYLDVNLYGKLCLNLPRAHASATISLTPTVRVSPEGGVSASVGVGKVGLSIAGSFNYRLEPIGTAEMRGASLYRACANLYHGWPGNHVDLFAWYQLRRVKFCKRGWFKYPCGFSWGSKKRCCLSKRWNISSGSRSKIWGRCSARRRYG